MATYSYKGKDYTQEQMDAIAKKATPSQREAINKQFGTEYARAEPVFSGTPVKGAPPTNTGVVGPARNTGIVPPAKSTEIPAPVKITEANKSSNTTPVIAAPVKGSFGDVAADNVHAQTFEDTGVAFKENADKYAKQISDIATKEGADKKKLIEESNVEKLARTKLQEEELARMKTSEKAGQEKLRSDVSKITAIQDQIASRNANASAAQAGESGLQLSQAAMDDVRNDIMAKYGQNIANAKQFELQTNTSIEAALQNIDNNIFGKQDAINTFKNALKDAEFAPVLNAVTAAAQGQKDAAKDVLDYYKKYIDMKAAEEYTSMAAMNTRDRKDKEWQAATPMQKISLIKAYGGDSMAPYIDTYIQKIGDYEGMSMDMVLGKIAKIAEQDGRGKELVAAYTQMLAQGGKHIPEMDILLKDLADRANRAGDMADLTKDQTIEQMNGLNKKDMDGNPNAYNNADNLAFYKGLSPQDKAKLDQSFVALTKSGVDRGVAFEQAKASLTAGNVSTVAKAKDTFNIKPDNIAILDKQVQAGKKDAAIAILEKQLATETGVTKRATLENSIRYLKQF